jgi:CubicO group peptidase (beta-lactamase class C family)
MGHMRILSIILAAASCAISSPAIAQDKNGMDFDRFLEDAAAREALPSISVAVIYHGNAYYLGAEGLADPANEIPASIDTVYSTGSTVKPLTTLAVLRLAEMGLLDIDRPVTEFLPDDLDIPAGLEEATLRHMLAHHSGLAPSRPVQQVDIWSRQRLRSYRDEIASTTMLQKPGTAYEYCNNCFPFYEAIIERYSGKPFTTFLADEVFGPSGSLDLSPIVPSIGMTQFMARPHAKAGGQAVPMQRRFLDFPSSGDFYQRPIDMAKNLRMLLYPRETAGFGVSMATLEKQRTRQFTGDVGLGVMVYDEDGRMVLNWTGGTSGFSTNFALEPEADIGVYLATNMVDSTAELYGIGAELLDYLRDCECEDALAARHAALAGQSKTGEMLAIRSDAEGIYRIEGTPARFQLVSLGRALALVNPAGARFELLEGKQADEFYLIGAEEALRIVRGDDSAARAIELRGPDGSLIVSAVRQEWSIAK